MRYPSDTIQFSLYESAHRFGAVGNFTTRPEKCYILPEQILHFIVVTDILEKDNSQESGLKIGKCSDTVNVNAVNCC